jgi:hypothetical protein
MGRQVQFNALPADLREFLNYVEARDPVIVTVRDSDSPEIKALTSPSLETQVMTLWNQGLVSSLERKRIVVPGRDYYSFDSSLPILELSPSRLCEWNGRESLLCGRVYANFETSARGYESWYNSLSRWIRAHFIKSPLPLVPYVGPAAYDWYKKGGLLLPMMIPPATTPPWLSWVEAQDQHRAVFSK